MIESAFWLGALVVFAIGEALTVGLTSIWFAVGALGALAVSGLGGAVWLQTAVFLLLSAVSMLLVRPLAKRLLKPGYTATNADRVLGRTAVVTEEINNVTGSGLVSVSGQIWSARSQQNLVIPVNSQVRILRIEGVKVFVETVS